MITYMEEVWKPIKDYEGLYEVSNLGRVKSLERVVEYTNGFKRRLGERLLKLTRSKNGYLVVNLSKNNESKTVNVHNLVFYTFNRDKIDFKLDINHIDGNKSNNNLENLELVTRSENLKHSYKHNLHKGREKHPMAKLTEGEVQKIKEELKYDTHKNISERYGVSRQTITNINRGIVWK